MLVRINAEAKFHWCDFEQKVSLNGWRSSNSVGAHVARSIALVLTPTFDAGRRTSSCHGALVKKIIITPHTVRRPFEAGASTNTEREPESLLETDAVSCSDEQQLDMLWIGRPEWRLPLKKASTLEQATVTLLLFCHEGSAGETLAEMTDCHSRCVATTPKISIRAL